MKARLVIPQNFRRLPSKEYRRHNDRLFNPSTMEWVKTQYAGWQVCDDIVIRRIKRKASK